MSNTKIKIKICVELYKVFFYIGIFTFGGGYAMLPLLTKKVVEEKQWASEEELLNYFALAQCTPGIIAVNTATFVGYKLNGILGGIFATLGFISPSIIIILSLASLLKYFFESPLVKSAFSGIRIAVTALIVSTVIKLVRSNANSIIKICMSLFAFITVAFFKVSPITISLVAALIGIGLWHKEYKRD